MQHRIDFLFYFILAVEVWRSHDALLKFWVTFFIHSLFRLSVKADSQADHLLLFHPW